MLQCWPNEGTAKPKRMSHMGDDPKHTWKQELWDVVSVSMVQICGAINHMHIWTGLVNISVSLVFSGHPRNSHEMSPNTPGHRLEDNNISAYLLSQLQTNSRDSELCFIFNDNMLAVERVGLYVCANHFTWDCFSNEGQYKAGFASTLTPSICTQATGKCRRGLIVFTVPYEYGEVSWTMANSLNVNNITRWLGCHRKNLKTCRLETETMLTVCTSSGASPSGSKWYS